MHVPGNALRVCGVDGCPKGWVVATNSTLAVVEHLDEITDKYDIIGIDMPIGLSGDGQRACDSQARKALRARASTIFSAPPRSLLSITDYATANAASRQGFGRGISRQAFAIWPKIRELDAIAQVSGDRFVEVHPECSFTRMTGLVPVSKHLETGKKFRREAVQNAFGVVPTSAKGAKPDDVLDAYAVLWSALRYAQGLHESFGDGSRDSCGLPMRIVV